ncbi:MAG: DNA polymerase III subunit alpha [Fusobacteriaceae bacterium]
MNKNFTHLHLHSEYSLLDGVGKIDQYLDRCLELGMRAMALTDHGNMFGAVEFYKKALKKGIKPIIGMETYIVQDRFSKERDEENLNRRNYHLVLLAKDEIGYRNLMKLSSAAYTEGFYYRPRIDRELLKKHSEGLIALSACMHGEIAYAILHNAPESEIDSLTEEYISIFGRENFYLEMQSNGINEQKILNEKLFELAHKFNLSLVVTNDVHYIHKGDHELQDIAICIQTGAKVSDEKRMKIETHELYFKSREQMSGVSLFFTQEYILGKGNEVLRVALEKALDTTLEISERCNLEIKFGEFKFPKYPLPSGFNSIESFLRDRVFHGLSLRYPDGYPESVTERAEYELSVINRMGYAEYFIVVWDFIRYAREQNIPIGPGRGSAAGSLVSYALKITDLDPLEYGLIFERFLNPERISMPDIDIDICQERRQEVIAYVTEKYGNDRVAQIITFGRMKARAAVRDIGRVMGTPLTKVDKLAKLLLHDSIKASIASVPEVGEIYNGDPEMQKILDFAIQLENSVRHASIHAAGIVITENPLTDYVPLYSDSRGESISTQYQMKELEDLGLLKMDFLGLRNLTVLERALQYVKKNHNISILLNEIPLNSSRVYHMLSMGDSSGVFQLESQGIRNLMKKLKPERFNDIIALLALYRPGPLGSGMVDSFVNCKNGIEKIKYPDPSLEDVLRETYGVILYQEQVMKIAQIMADYTLGEADNLRRAMGKKDFQLMENNRLMFTERAQKKGYSQERAEEIFFLIDKFAGYGFNKSHSAAYALIAYWTAYFKSNYPAEYYAAIISTQGDIENIAFYIEDARTHGINLLAPDINHPSLTFDVIDGKIRLAIPGVKNIGVGFTEKLIEDWKNNGEYTSYEDFSIRGKRFGLSKKILHSLIASGALDSLPGNRKQKMESLEKVLDYGERVNREDEIQQMNLFGEAKTVFQRFHLPEISEFPIDEMIGLEKENLGFYLSAHPLDRYRTLINLLKTPPISLLLNEKDVQGIKTCGIIKGLKKIVTRKEGKIMATFFLEDFSGKIPVTLFPKTYEESFHFLEEGASVFIEGNLQTDYFNNNETQKLLVRSITPLDSLDENKELRCYILIREEDRDKFNRLKIVLQNHPGKNPVSFAIKKDGEKTVKNSKFQVSISPGFLEDIVELMGAEQIVIK